MLGVDLDVITEKLQVEGVRAFSASLDKRLANLGKRRHAIHA
jgi:hypothetical protein